MKVQVIDVKVKEREFENITPTYYSYVDSIHDTDH